MTSFKLSILCITYNHAAFIRQALDGFVMQQTNFPFEVLIHDDASTDGTADIIREYEEKYPDIIKPVYQKENQWSQGVAISKTFQFPRIQGMYVAMCEGDDYWTDPRKLQKQVDFLDAHPDYTVCFHPVEVQWEKDPEKKEIFPTPDKRFNKTTLDVEDLIQHNFIQTNSVVYRWVFPEKEHLEDYPVGILPGDWYLHLVHAKHGKIGFLEDVMGVYRRHPGGMWQGNNYLRHGDKHYHFFEAADKLLEGKYHALYEKKKREYWLEMLRFSVMLDDFATLSRLGRLPPGLVEKLGRTIIPWEKQTWKHRFINKLAKWLGIAPMYPDLKSFIAECRKREK
ncbi:MAG: glycosyltransferase [Planctomycetia bacterium]|nr:glycosyltransferase [Planctomycetia bacterium]